MALNAELYDDVYFSEKFKEIMRSCKEILLDNSSICVLNDKSFIYAHRNNPYSLLRGIGIDERLIWCTVFINDIKDDTNLVKLSTLFVPTLGIVDQLLVHYRTNIK